jgi:hypothetical protein
MRHFFVAAIVLATTLPVTASAAVCPTCGIDHSTQNSRVNSSAQQIAQQRANYMAARGYKGHPPQSAGSWSRVGSFEGVGWAGGRRGKHSIATCTPGRSRQLVGDAVAYGRGGSYRVRIWR